MNLYVPGQFEDEARRAAACYAHLDTLLQAKQVDEADSYMCLVLSLEGRRIYETVLSMVAMRRGIPPLEAH